MQKFIKKIWEAVSTGHGLYGIISSEFFRTWVWPPLAGVVVLMSSFFSDHGVPLSFAITAALLAFASLAGGLLWFHKLQAERTPLNKLRFVGPGVGRDLNPPEDGQAAKLKYFQLIVVVHNSAPFPISCKVESIENIIIERVNGRVQRIMSDIPFEPVRYNIAPGQFFQLRGKRIDMGGAECKNLECELKYKLMYGHSGREIYPLADNMNIEVRFDINAGNVTEVIANLTPAVEGTKV